MTNAREEGDYENTLLQQLGLLLLLLPPLWRGQELSQWSSALVAVASVPELRTFFTDLKALYTSMLLPLESRKNGSHISDHSSWQLNCQALNSRSLTMTDDVHRDIILALPYAESGRAAAAVGDPTSHRWLVPHKM